MNMKIKWVFLALILGMVLVPIFLLRVNRNDINNEDLQVEDNVLDASTSNEAVELAVNGNTYSVAWFEVGDTNDIELRNNLNERKNSQQIIKDDGCKNLVNGGFYTEDYKPTGLLVTDCETITGYRSNRLFNGIFYITQTGDAGIASDYGDVQYKHAIQTGPILVNDSLERKLNIRNDEPARRVVVAVTNSGSVVFAVVFNKESHFLGPTLEDLPSVIKTLSDEFDLDIKTAINLDGGSASVFVSEDLKLQELSVVGSFFCVN